MQLPDLPPGKCINHPDRKAVQKHLCDECFKKWQSDTLRFEAFLDEPEGVEQ